MIIKRDRVLAYGRTGVSVSGGALVYRQKSGESQLSSFSRRELRDTILIPILVAPRFTVAVCFPLSFARTAPAGVGVGRVIWDDLSVGRAAERRE